MAEDVAPFDRAAFFTRLRAATPARIGLARHGVSIGTQDSLAFEMAHAKARDAVHDKLDVCALVHDLRSRGWDAVTAASEARDRHTYLARPDLGRRLDMPSREALTGYGRACDVAIVIADGLSARAISSHAVPLLERLFPALMDRALMRAPIVVVEQGRVAIGDEIGALLGAKIVCVMIGERPGLSSPDSLGVYLTWAPKVGRTDAERNCVSNIRPQGMSYDEAARRCAWLILEARQRGMTGVMLKDDSAEPRPLPPRAGQGLRGS